MILRRDPRDEDRPEERELAQTVRKDNKAREAVIALERNGRLTPDQVLKAAKNPSSPLHSYFEWDDDKAAHLHRVEQARRLIRVVKLVVETAETIVALPRYVRDPSTKPGEQGYVSIEQLKTEPENAMAQIAYEFVRALGCVERAERIATSLEVEADVRNIVRSIKKIIQACQPEAVTT